MATEAQLIAGLQAASKAGNTADARTFAQALAAMRAQNASSTQSQSATPVTVPPANATSQQQNYSWSDVPLAALGNTPGSAGRFLGGIYQAVRHPIDTAKTLGELAVGEGEHLANAAHGGGDPTATLQNLPQWMRDAYGVAGAVNKSMADRYGSGQAVRNTLATDPVGVAADLSMLLSGGETALADAPGIAGKVGEAAGAAGHVLNPVNAAAKGVGVAAKVAAPAFQAVADAPSVAALKDAARAAYAKAQSAGIAIKGDAFKQMVDNLAADLQSKGIDPTLHPKATAALKRLQDAAASAAPPSADDIQAVKAAAAANGRAAAKVKRLQQAQAAGQRVQGALKEAIAEQQQAAANLKQAQQALVPQDVSLEDLDTLRRIAGHAADASDKSERMMGRVIKDHIDDFVGNLTPDQVSGNLDTGALRALSNARDYWARASKGEIIDRAIEKAKNDASGLNQSGYENALRRRFLQIANNDRALRRFSPAEQKAIVSAARGGPVINTLRFLARFSPRHPVYAGIGAGLGAVLGAGGGPVGSGIGAVGVPLASDIAGRAAEMLRARKAAGVSALVRGAPLDNATVPTKLSLMLNGLGDKANALNGTQIPQLGPLLYEANQPRYVIDKNGNVQLVPAPRTPLSIGFAPVQ